MDRESARDNVEWRHLEHVQSRFTLEAINSN